MTSWIEPPPPQRGMGCFAKGCLTVVVFFALLIAAFIGGGYFAFRHVRSVYFPETPIVLPNANVSDVEIQRAQERWAAYETAVRAKEPAHVELTAAQINALIAGEPDLRDKFFVSIENNVAHVQMSVRLEHLLWLSGHYVNAECSVRPAQDKNPAEAKISNVIVNGRPVSDEAMTWRYRSRSVRGFLSDWALHHDVTRFDIVDDKVVLESKGAAD